MLLSTSEVFVSIFFIIHQFQSLAKVYSKTDRAVPIIFLIHKQNKARKTSEAVSLFPLDLLGFDSTISVNMNDADVSKQIQQMVRFIRQEAEEKANEISVSAEEEFNIEKLQLVEADKKKIRQEYERKEKQVDVRKKIEYSMQLNASRLKVLQAQDDVVNKMKEAAAKELLNVSGDPEVYGNLLKELIIQSLLRLKEPSVLLRCREVDLPLVEDVLESAAQEYAEKANVHVPEVVIDKDVYLPPAPSHHNPHDLHCSGGVVLASHDGKIVFENTLDARLDVLFRNKLPAIRKELFGQVAV